MPHKFILLASYRSGSTWVIDVLNHIEGTTAFSELFSVPADRAGTQNLTNKQTDQTTEYLDRGIRAYPHFYQSAEIKQQFRPFSVFTYLNSFFQQEGNVGFKLMYAQLARHPEIWGYVIRHHILIIHLVRSNYLDVIISREVRKATNTTHQVDGFAKSEKIQVMLDPQDTVRRLQSLQRNVDWARRLIRWSRVPSLELRYEDLVKDAANFGPLWKFLQISEQQARLESKLVKLVRGSYPELIANYDDLDQALKGTEFANLLEQ